MIYIWNTPIVATIENILQDLKNEVRELGLLRQIKDVGNDFMITCPFHNNGKERKASCGVSKNEVRKGDKLHEAGTIHCYTCGWVGDLPKLVSELLGISILEGFKWLVSRYNYSTGSRRDIVQLDLDRGIEAVREPVCITYFEDKLVESAKAKSYLRGRKLDVEVCRSFGIGYNPENDTIVIPIPNKDGLMLMLKERSIKGKSFINSKGSNKAGLVFGLYQAILKDKNGDRRWWIVESEIDALYLWSIGEIAVAIMGSHISEEQIKELCKSPCRKLILGLDNDKAGKEGIRKMKDKLIPLGFRLFNIDWNCEGIKTKKDINELTVEQVENLQLY